MNFGKLFFAAVLAFLSVVSGYVYWHQHAEAARITSALRPYEAKVEELRPQGRRWYSLVTLNVDGRSVRSVVDAKVGVVGATVTVWSKPGFALSYPYRTQLQERASRSWWLFFFLLPNIVLFSMLLLWRSPRKPATA